MNYIENGDSLNSTDSLTLAGLAQLCPSTQGASAYNASVLYRAAYGAILECNCEESGSKYGFINNSYQKNTSSTTKSIFIYPNPAQDRISISCKGATGPLEVRIFDLTGRILFNKTLLFYNGKATLDLNLNNGAYLIKTIDSRGIQYNYSLIISN